MTLPEQPEQLASRHIKLWPAISCTTHSCLLFFVAKTAPTQQKSG